MNNDNTNVRNMSNNIGKSVIAENMNNDNTNVRDMSNNIGKSMIAGNMNTASYVIYKDTTGNINAVNGNTGNVDKLSTDAYTTIQYAINAMTGGGLLFIKKGSYTLTQTLIMPGGNRFSLQGESQWSTILSSTGSNLMIVGDNTATFSFSLQEIALVGATGVTDLLTIRDTDNAKIEHCEFYGFNNGIIFDAYGTGSSGHSYYNVVTDCSILGVGGSPTGTGIKFTGPNNSWTSNSNTVIGGYCYNCDIGIHFDRGDTNNIIGPDLTNCNTGTKLGIYAQENKFIGLRCEGNTTDVNIAATDNDNVFFGGSFSTVSNLGNRNKFLNIIGYKTSCSVFSARFPIDSTGIKSLSIPHGLDIIPGSQNCTLQVIENTAVNDWGYDLLKNSGSDHSYTYVKINVSKASTTAGATARIGLTINNGI